MSTNISPYRCLSCCLPCTQPCRHIADYLFRCSILSLLPHFPRFTFSVTTARTGFVAGGTAHALPGRVSTDLLRHPFAGRTNFRFCLPRYPASCLSEHRQQKRHIKRQGKDLTCTADIVVVQFDSTAHIVFFRMIEYCFCALGISRDIRSASDCYKCHREKKQAAVEACFLCVASSC